jgi:putative exporter of polyketide antibiotics
MTFSRKDWMGVAVYVLGAVLAVFLGLMPEFMKLDWLSLKQSSVISFGLLIASLICFAMNCRSSRMSDVLRMPLP